MGKMTRVERKRRRKRRFFRIVLLLIICFISLRLAKKSNYFKIRSIDVEGNKHLQKEVIIDKTNIKVGMNIIDVSLLKSERAIKKLIYVKNVSIKRKLPNKINIKIDERKELLQFKVNNKYIVIDDEEIILDISDKQRTETVILEGINFKNPILKGSIGSKMDKFFDDKDMEDFLYTNIRLGLLNRFKLIKVSKDKNIDLITKDDKEIRFGNVFNSNYKLSLLKEMFNHIDKEEIEYSKILMDKGDNPVIVTEKAGG